MQIPPWGLMTDMSTLSVNSTFYKLNKSTRRTPNACFQPSLTMDRPQFPNLVAGTDSYHCSFRKFEWIHQLIRFEGLCISVLWPPISSHWPESGVSDSGGFVQISSAVPSLLGPRGDTADSSFISGISLILLSSPWLSLWVREISYSTAFILSCK